MPERLNPANSYTKCNKRPTRRGELEYWVLLRSGKKREATMTYYQLTPDERYTIASMRAVGRRPAEIARVLGRHRSTICREIQRNRCAYDGNYRVQKAQSRTNGRRRMSRQGQRSEEHTSELQSQSN